MKTERGKHAMSATILYMSMSVDGFITGPNDGVGNGLGDRGERLHEWIFAAGGVEAGPGAGDAGERVGVNGSIVDECMSTGAVVVGRRTFEHAGGFEGDHHDGVQIFAVGRSNLSVDISEWPLVTYLGDVSEAMARAKEAAGEKDVLVHGASLAQAALAAGVLDELELHVVPVFLGRGRRLFENLDADRTELERTRILEGENGVTHMRYRVKR